MWQYESLFLSIYKNENLRKLYKNGLGFLVAQW